MEQILNPATEQKLLEYNREQARKIYSDILDKTIERLIIAEDLIYKKELTEDYTLDDLYSIIREALKESREKSKLTKYKPITLAQFLEIEAN